MDDERAIELYSLSRRIRVGLDGHARFARFIEFPDEVALGDWRSPFTSAAHQHLQDLANLVNEFTLHLNALRSWGEIWPTLADDEQLPVALEFVNSTAYFCLGTPYALKGRLHHSIAVVSHLANEFAGGEWDFRADLGHSSYDSAKGHAHVWRSWPRLRSALGRLDNRPFRVAVSGFRNEFQHGAPPSIQIGYRPFARRITTIDGRDGVAVGAQPPLALDGVIAALAPQQVACVSAYDSFAELVLEQLAVVMTNKRFQRATDMLGNEEGTAVCR